MRALVAFCSVTGTTRRVAEHIAEGLESAGVAAVLHDLRDGPPDITAFDILGFGFPTHFYRAAMPAEETITALGRLDGRSAFLFALYGTYRGSALNHARATLRRAGATEIGVFSCLGDDRFLGYTRLGYEFSPDHPTAEELEAARQFGRGLVATHAALQEGRMPTPDPVDPRTPLVFALERAAFSPLLVRSVHSRAFRPDPAVCTRCGRCSRVCPNSNVAWERHELPTWGRECMGCFECVASCPENAIHSALDWLVFRPFLAHNVRRAAHDPALEHAQVELQRGKIVRT